MWCVYIVECKDRTLYTGITNSLTHRVIEHNRATGAKYTRQRRPVRLVYWEKTESQSAAAKREGLIKGWSRKKKIELIGSGQQNRISTLHNRRSGKKKNHSSSGGAPG